MKWFFFVISFSFFLVACIPLLSSDEAAAERTEVDTLLAAGEITEQQATWRREDIARFESFYAFDMGSAQTLIGLLVSSVGASLGLTRLQRGAAKPIPKSSVPSFQATVRANGNA